MIALRRHIRTVSAVAIALALVSCGSATEPAPPAIPGTLTLTVLPVGSLDVAAGRRVVANMGIQRGGGYDAPVTVAVQGAPDGLTVGYSSTVLEAGGTSSIVTFDAAPSLAPGAYTLTFTATGAGVPVASVSKTLNVSPAIVLTVAPAAQSVVAGAAVASNLTIVRGPNFVADVALSSTGAPTGMTIEFAPAVIPTAATTSAATITVAGSVPAGVYPITISAAGPNVLPATGVLTVTVTPAVAGRTVSVTYCAADAPIWVAYQDGASGPWTRVLPDAGTNTYQFAIASGKAGVVSVDTVADGYNVAVSYATTDEIGGVANTLGQSACNAKTVNGSFLNLSPADRASVTLGSSTAFVQPGASPSVALTGVEAGPQDLVAARQPSGSTRPDRLILRRGLDITSGGSLSPLDFGSAEAFAPATANFSIAGVGADTAFVILNFMGIRGSAEGFIENIDPYIQSTGVIPYAAIPASRLNTGELQRIYAASLSPNSGDDQRFAARFFRTPADITLTLGPVLATPTVSRIAGGGYSRARIQLPLQSEYNRIMLAAFRQAGVNGRSLTLTATTGYTGGTAWDFTIPVLSGTAGWLDAWGPRNGTPLDWTLTAFTGVFFELDPNAGEGNAFLGATRRGGSPLP